MSFNVALSGIAAAQSDLDTTANNIANVSTVGFKESRTEFDSVYANSLFSNSSTKVGDGVSVAAVAQQFSQGSLLFTNNPLDLAITGSGFFATSGGLEDSDLSYTRAGTFKLDSDNFVVDNSGNYLQAFPVNEDGTSSSVSLSTTKPIQIPETAGTPVMTSEISIALNLDADSTALEVSLFDLEDSDTYNNATSVTIYDSLGKAHVASTYYIKPIDATSTSGNEWVCFMAVDGIPVNPTTPGSYSIVDDPITGSSRTEFASAPYTDDDGLAQSHTGVVLKFDTEGNYDTTAISDLTFETLGEAGVLDAGANQDQSISLDFDSPTQYASNFEVTGLEQDGLTVGRLTGVEIGDDGLVEATYSNGTSQPLSRVAIVRFLNEQGLAQTGSSWIASQNSGDPIAGEAGSGSFGSINSAALEQANVNLTTELVDLITAQRNFQANSRSLEISNELQQTILQIR